MHAIGLIRGLIREENELEQQMEEMLARYILPELTGNQPLMRTRACQTYAAFGDMKFDSKHLQ